MNYLKLFYLLTAFSFIFIFCEKESNIKTQDVELLVKQAMQENISEERYDFLNKKVKSLNQVQLELFFDLSLDKMIEKEGKVNVSSNEIEKIKTFRRSVLRRAVNDYGVSFFNLTNDKQRLLIESTMGQRESKKSADCPITTYPARVCRVNTFDSGRWTLYQRFSTPPEPGEELDCDYEYSYAGIYNATFAPTIFDRWLLDYWGNCGVGKRNVGNTTRIQLGQRGVWLFIGFPWLVNVRMEETAPIIQHERDGGI